MEETFGDCDRLYIIHTNLVLHDTVAANLFLCAPKVAFRDTVAGVW